MYAKIIVDISHENVDRPFEYRIPEHLLSQVRIGSSVMIPFGKGNTVRQGYVIELTQASEYDSSKIKDILEITQKDVTAEDKMLQLAAWMKHRYGSTMITAMKTVLPARQKKKSLEKKEIVRLISEEDTRILYDEVVRKHQTAKARLLQELIGIERLPYELVKQKLHIAPATITSLEKQGALAVESTRIYRNPVQFSGGTVPKKILSAEQQQIVDAITSDYDNGNVGTYLIHGITGSGKTEVYMELIENCIKRGRQAIVLIPEIALTYQTVMRFYRRFGKRVSVMNSSLSAGEKYDQCERAKNGDIDVIIGPRSALFTPFQKLGLIVIDEEHEPSYKSETMPKYHAREAAIYLASLHHASVVLGSATPSMDSFYHAKCGDYGLFTLNRRLTGNVLPTVHVADLRQELKEGNRSIFSRKLQELIEDRLEKKQQIMLFLNRRGYAGFVSCRSCGHVMTCPHCDVSLSEHKGNKLVCHYCGYETPKVSLCPECGSKYILGFKAGTEAIEEKLKEMYSHAKVLRMDGDTTKTKDSYEKILSAFSEGQADILLGTQMIVKGHDFPNVTLVGVLAADMSLFAGDYRAAERTFQLLTQAAGRAGRGDTAGEVVIQTYQPEHYSIVHSANQDYDAFYEEEILYRELAHYPPAEHMLAVLVTSKQETLALEQAGKLAELLRKRWESKNLTVMGPASASIGKIQDVYRMVLYCKSADYEMLVQAKDLMEQNGYENTQMQFDFNPISSY